MSTPIPLSSPPPGIAPTGWRASFGRSYGAFLLLLLAVALVTRCQQYGNPIVHIDEQFYLLVGGRMLSGAIPYVDIWDRKPIGLFLIYAAIRELGGTGVIPYQLLATGFAIATAIVVERIASRFAGPRGARLAAIAYLLWIPLLTGQGGQSPVFYNLFVAFAALTVCRCAETAPARPFRLGAVAMLAIGVALQIKYSAIFEGLFFGLALLWIAMREGLRWRLLPAAAGWIVAALLPTMAAGGYYRAIGHFPEFWFANFVSIFQRHPLDPGDTPRNAASLLLYLSPLLVLAAHGAKLRHREAGADFAQSFAALWLVVAIAAVVLFGYYFDHYGLPIVAPAAVSAATALDRRPRHDWPLLILAGALLACLLLPTFNQRRRGTPAQYAQLVGLLRPYAGSLFVWDDLPALYDTLHAPLPTRYPFAPHLRDPNEIGAVGIDQPRELRRILDAHPAAIVVEEGKPGAVVLPPTMFVLGRLARGYRFRAAVRVGRRDQRVYVWKGLPAAR